jgi:hypothetical protein
VVDINPMAWFTFDLTDQQWSSLVRLSGALPEGARTEFKDCVSGYLLARRWHFEHEVGRRDGRDRLRGKILTLMEDSEWKRTITSSNMGFPGPIARLLDQSLNLLAIKLAYANARLGPDISRPGPKSSQPSYQLIANAAALLEKYTQMPATRSEKSYKSNFRDFIKELCAIADASITSGTIDEALKRYIKKRRQERRGEDRPSSV